MYLFYYYSSVKASRQDRFLFISTRTEPYDCLLCLNVLHIYIVCLLIAHHGQFKTSNSFPRGSHPISSLHLRPHGDDVSKKLEFDFSQMSITGEGSKPPSQVCETFYVPCTCKNICPSSRCSFLL